MVGIFPSVVYILIYALTLLVDALTQGTQGTPAGPLQKYIVLQTHKYIGSKT